MKIFPVYVLIFCNVDVLKTNLFKRDVEVKSFMIEKFVTFSRKLKIIPGTSSLG